MHLEMQVVSYRGDAADHFPAFAREEELDCAMLVKWVPGGVDQLLDVTAKRRNPVLVAAIKREWKLDELFPVAL